MLYSAKLEREDKFLAIGAQGRSPAIAATQWQLNQPGRAGLQQARPARSAGFAGMARSHKFSGLAVSPLQLSFDKRNGQLPLRRQRRGIQPFEQIEQPLHITRAAGKDKARHVVTEVQTTAARTQQ